MGGRLGNHIETAILLKMKFYLRRRSKYNNRKVSIDGVSFDSKKEAAHWNQLKIREASGQIRKIEPHPKFTLQESFQDHMGGKHRAITYEADFRYFDIELGKTVVVDVKASKFMLTDVYKIKKKLFLKKLDSSVLFLELF